MKKYILQFLTYSIIFLAVGYLFDIITGATETVLIGEIVKAVIMGVVMTFFMNVFNTEKADSKNS